MATSNREFDNGIILDGIDSVKARDGLISEKVQNVEVDYDSPHRVGGPGYARVTVTTVYTLLQDDVDAFLKNAFK